MPNVGVLLAVHQPGSFLAPQIQSIRRQQGVNVRLFFHLDSDFEEAATITDLTDLPCSSQTPTSSGQGVPDAYFAMMRAVDEDLDYWAFADQDDIWHEDKLSRATRALNKVPDVPALWVSRVQVISTSLSGDEVLGIHPGRISETGLANALVETIAPGCTMVFNKALYAILRENVPEGPVLMHDAWAYLVAAALGTVIVDNQPLVQYRLHDQNAIGIRSSLRARIRRRWQLWFGEGTNSPAEQAKTFLHHFQHRIDPDHEAVIYDLAESRRWRLLRHWLFGRIRRNQPRDNLMLPLAMITLPPHKKHSH